jgi:hypothetical protein
MQTIVIQYFEEHRFGCPSSHTTSRELFHGSRFTAENTVSLVAGVCTVCGQVAFPVSWGRCYNVEAY